MKYLTGGLLLISILLHGAEPQLKLSTLEEALTYNGEKIVYLSVGSFPSDEKAIWQVVPKFMEQFAKQSSQRCKCISIDPVWNMPLAGSINPNYEGFVAGYLQNGEPIPQEYYKVPEGYKLFFQRFKQLSASASHLLLVVVGSYVRDLDESKIYDYLARVLNNGGVVFIGHFPGLFMGPQVMHSYNKLVAEFNNKIIYFEWAPFLAFWLNGDPYVWYDEVILEVRWEARRDLAKEIIKKDIYFVTSWYKNWFSAKVSTPTYGITSFYFQQFSRFNSGFYYDMFVAEPLQRALSDPASIVDDLLNKVIPCKVAPYGQDLSTITFNLTSQSGNYSIEDPHFPSFDLYDLSSYHDVPAATVQRVKREGESLHGTDDLEELQRSLGMLVLATAH